jgi:UDP-N-acetylglucosamine acyltransferase
MVNSEGKGGGVEIGPRTVVREMVTVHRSIHEGEMTRVGEECYLMTQSHVAHDCELGDRVILVNWVGLSGHVEVANDCFITGYVGIHQFVRIGEGVILTGPNAVRKDVPPFTLVDGNPPRVRGLNAVGLRRRGVSAEVRALLKKAYQILFQEAKTIAEGADRIEAELMLGSEIKSVVGFVRGSKRGIYQGRV